MIKINASSVTLHADLYLLTLDWLVGKNIFIFFLIFLYQNNLKAVVGLFKITMLKKNI